MAPFKTIRDESGYALVAVLLVLGALTGLVMVAHANSRVDQRIGANATSMPMKARLGRQRSSAG